MVARYEFLVGPMNRNSDYAKPVSVLADTYSEARSKAVAFRALKPRDTTTWLLSITEIDPNTQVLEQLAALLKEKDNGHEDRAKE